MRAPFVWILCACCCLFVCALLCLSPLTHVLPFRAHTAAVAIGGARGQGPKGRKDAKVVHGRLRQSGKREGWGWGSSTARGIDDTQQKIEREVLAHNRCGAKGGVGCRRALGGNRRRRREAFILKPEAYETKWGEGKRRHLLMMRPTRRES